MCMGREGKGSFKKKSGNRGWGELAGARRGLRNESGGGSQRIELLAGAVATI